MSSTHTIYFGYGSNLWLHQMRTRCPSSTYKGVARLDNYRWIINDRGYANVVEVSSSSSSASSITTTTSSTPPSDVVYGLVYTLSPTDESRLDRNEGVPIAYTKENLRCSFWAAASTSSPVDVSDPPTSNKDMLVYIDRERIVPDKPKQEYVYRMNKGIDDALAMGVPKKYVDEVMRKFIPKDGNDGKGVRNGEVEAKALRQAIQFEDESGVF